MSAHLRYLRYVLTHKLYVFVAGLAIARVNGYHLAWYPWWIWRLLVHDLSKFRPSEWRPYVANFYGGARDGGIPRRNPSDVQAQFNHAWLLHQHRNSHHWQHWILKEDSGKTLVLLMDRFTADEMLADWLGAGTKVLQHPAFATCVAETVSWYAKQANVMALRVQTRQHVEETLVALADRSGVLAAALEIHMIQQVRDSIVIPGRNVSQR